MRRFALLSFFCSCLLSVPTASFGIDMPYPTDVFSLKGEHRGPRGHRGRRGPKGHKGNHGPTGPTGLQGETGATGESGSVVTAMAQQFAPSTTGVTGPTFIPEATLQLVPIGTIGVGSHAESTGDVTFDSTLSQFTIKTAGTYLLRYGMVAQPNTDFFKASIRITESISTYLVDSIVTAYITPVITRGSTQITIGAAPFILGTSTNSTTIGTNVVSAYGQCLYNLQAEDIVDLELFFNITQPHLNEELATQNDIFYFSSTNMCPGGTLTLEKIN